MLTWVYAVRAAVHWQNGVRAIRVFIGIDGFKSKTPVQYPTQPKMGVYSETALRRLDYCVYAAGRVSCSERHSLASHHNGTGAAHSL